MQLKLGHVEDRMDLLSLVSTCQQLRPQGFREPSRKNGREQDCSRVELLSIELGIMDPPARELGKRAKKKLMARRLMLVRAEADRQFPDPRHVSPAHRRHLNKKTLSAHKTFIDIALAKVEPVEVDEAA